MLPFHSHCLISPFYELLLLSPHFLHLIYKIYSFVFGLVPFSPLGLAPIHFCGYCHIAVLNI